MLNVRTSGIWGYAAALAVLLAAAPASAGPPYLSDDPVPTDPGHWEIYNYIGGARASGVVGGEAGVDLNYGAAKDLQLTAVLPVGFERDHGLHTGAGNIELAAKYRFIHQDEKGLTPDVAFFPRLFAPTGGHRFSTGHASLLLPIWLQKDAGPWSVFGGGGYTINPGADQRSFWQGGIAVSRAFGKRMTLGGEVFGQTRDAVDGGAFRAVNLALTYKLVKHWSLLASAGPTWERTSRGGYVFYLSLKADY